MKRVIHNVLLAVDLVLNRGAYVEQMRANGFLVDDRSTVGQLYSFFRR